MKFNFLLLLLCPMVCFGEIYECQKDAMPVFMDRPCSTQGLVQVRQITTLHTQSTILSAYNQQTVSKPTAKNKKIKKRKKKQASQLSLSSARRRIRCKILAHKIHNIEERFKMGYTLKQGDRLKKQLEYFKLQQLKDCKH